MKWMVELGVLFDRAMFDIYNRARQKCDYNATRFLQMLIEKGGLITARQLLTEGNPQEGFVHLWECGCLDLTVEALVLQDPFCHLFSADELMVARSRLEDLGYDKR
jgi:hypothetical protein